MAEAVVVSCACVDGAEADRIATALVERRLAACVQLLPVESLYRWQGEVQRGGEVLIQAKTLAVRLPAIEALIAACHSYDLPEIVAVPIVGGSARYLAWLAAEGRG